MLYHTYLGKNTQRSRRVPQGDCTLSQFLEKNLMNLEYQDRLEKELSNLMEEEKQRKEEHCGGEGGTMEIECEEAGEGEEEGDQLEMEEADW